MFDCDLSDTLDIYLPSKILRNISTTKKLIFIDFLDLLKTNNPEEHIYYAKDNHLTPKGQALLGEYVFKKVIENNLVS